MAAKSNEPNFCKFALDRSGCIWEVAEITANEKICDEIPEQKPGCDYNKSELLEPKCYTIRSECYCNVAVGKDDVNVCLKANLGIEGRTSCVIDFAKLTGNPEFCEYLIGGNNYVEGLNSRSRNFCVYEVLAVNLQLGKEQCNSIKDEQIKNECLEMFIVSWNEAVKILNTGQVSEISQNHSLDVTLVLKDGTQIHTKEPTIDVIFEEVKKCGEPCKDIVLSTE